MGILDTFILFGNTAQSLKTIMGLIVFGLFLVLVLVAVLGKEKFIGTHMWYGQGFQNANLTSKQERTDDLVKISKGELPGDRSASLLENFENVGPKYNPRNYEVQPDYHRTVQQFGVDPNPVESLETPEFMIPKTYKSAFRYENLVQVADNNIDAIKLNSIESTFNNIEQNKFYKDLLRSKCRAGNRSSHKNCGCSAPEYGEH